MREVLMSTSLRKNFRAREKFSRTNFKLRRILQEADNIIKLKFAAPSPIVTASFATAGLRSKFIMSKPKVFVTRPDIPIEAIDLLKERGAWTSWSPMWMCGQGLKDSVVGIVGMGRIGKAVVQRLQPFGVKQFLYFGRSRKADDSEVNAEYVTLDQLLMQSDFVIVTCALTKETNKMFGSEAFKKMKRTAIFVNTSRGDLVDQDALVDALKYKRIAAAGLDVMTPEPLPSNHELLSLNNCAILPHIGSATVRTRTDMALLTAHNILAGLEGNPMPAEVC
ncbi:glyoxylate reductase/hydroxypyruvate reductase-like isoform X5 [Ischnura elegans]|uniref:glyoxylate reductase/hydroxypyruvate reductase-like isoform X5 n=1 Tax=Ischnura elegans TaxID=197161 RepID=UPI001ED8AD71|nr:glyoxylate reductase/hydroxypyruvate reductase-like isoform X5 [Ischnura elegans]